ncbi:putative Uncharacterized 50.6 kDa protein in the 5'region of gyrA and gyrB [Burkholderia cenocepacia]|nr:putative Uncharacterized 50.6 kDa protein in the 5'region of gyrA and gyrB [Burkholderia cenocepacia]
MARIADSAEDGHRHAEPRRHDDHRQGRPSADRHAADRRADALRVRPHAGHRHRAGRLDLFDGRRLQPGEPADAAGRHGRGGRWHSRRDGSVRRADDQRDRPPRIPERRPGAQSPLRLLPVPRLREHDDRPHEAAGHVQRAALSPRAVGQLCNEGHQLQRDVRCERRVHVERFGRLPDHRRSMEDERERRLLRQHPGTADPAANEAAPDRRDRQVGHRAHGDRPAQRRDGAGDRAHRLREPRHAAVAHRRKGRRRIGHRGARRGDGDHVGRDRRRLRGRGLELQVHGCADPRQQRVVHQPVHAGRGRRLHARLRPGDAGPAEREDYPAERRELPVRIGRGDRDGRPVCGADPGHGERRRHADVGEFDDVVDPVLRRGRADQQVAIEDAAAGLPPRIAGKARRRSARRKQDEHDQQKRPTGSWPPHKDKSGGAT